MEHGYCKETIRIDQMLMRLEVFWDQSEQGIGNELNYISFRKYSIMLSALLWVC